MIQFTQLRLSGFKSFVEPTELDVEPGLTGVVGPNGCGKSNIVESLRWVMGESSAKQMRGGEMDDVIFAGTRKRPSRNVAEVTLTLDNSSRTAPAVLNTEDTLVVSRKISRGSGSTYRVNGKEVRARDVHLLFADASTGARSTAIVSQGKIGALIAANPSQRRALLEEAAGISGLYSRRHEAELRLRGAENNLTRLDDVLTALETQKQGLEKQCKQATRYRVLSDEIRALDIALLIRTAQDAETALNEARATLRDAEATVTQTTEAAAKASRKQFEAYHALEPARTAANSANSELQRLTLTRETLQQDERRLERAMRGNAERVGQIANDIAQAEHAASDASHRFSAIKLEISELEAELVDAPQREQAAREALTSAETLREHADAALSTATARKAAAEAELRAARTRQQDAQAALSRLQARLQQLDTDISKAKTSLRPDTELAQANTTLQTAIDALELCQQQRDQAEADRASCDAKKTTAQANFSEADGQLRRLDAEISALESVTKASAHIGDRGPAILAKVTVQSGYEKAFATVLEHGAEAPDDPQGTAPMGWRAYPPLPDSLAVPAGCTPLSHFASGPDSLSRRLGHAYLIDDTDLADRIAPTLKPGQCLVSQDGGLWRWDGFTRLPHAKDTTATATARQLQQANRLKELQAQRPELFQSFEQARDTLNACQTELQAAQTAERTARDAVHTAETSRQRAQSAHDQLHQQQSQAKDRLLRLEDSYSTVEQDVITAQVAYEATLKDSSEPSLSDLEAVTAAAKAEASAARIRATEARAALDTCLRQADSSQQRLKNLRQEIQDWKNRQTNADTHHAALLERQRIALKEREELQARPAILQQRRTALTAELITAEQAQKDTSDALAIAESELRAADSQQKEADRLAAQAREDRIRAEEMVERRKQGCIDIAQRCQDTLGCALEDVDTSVAAKHLDMSSEEIATRTARRHQERERLGPVNLRAELETEEVSNQIVALQTERDDLLAAISRLRQGIAELNREGRARLQKSFHAVNTVFQETFKRLFGGGQAYLTLVEDDDPLAAGIEIMASPPGKRLQLLSLLSGGEQALTALALLFAVFQSNPAPICILDEVDAPLDDANVDRFCALLAEMAKTGQTRFLIITHHRMTMARMDRLYGVTMIEQGVSQLVSVDLKMAETLREDPVSE